VALVEPDWVGKLSGFLTDADGIATRCHAHRYLGSRAPRSGLSRSDFVLWPISEATIPGNDGSYLRSCGRHRELRDSGSRSVAKRDTEVRMMSAQGPVMSTILYARVSMVDQTIDHQLSHAKSAGFAIDEVVADNGASGVTTRLVDRTEGRRLFDKLRSGDILVVRWVDRLGRNYEDVCDTIREFMRRCVVIRTVINNFTFDGATKDPMQQAVRDAIIGFMAATAQAQAEATKAAQRAGIEHAKQNEDRAYLGRKPSYTRAQFATVRDLLAQEAVGVSQIARQQA
jgi:putative DNA-invertase from lambdoid prophage Rac